ncbi:methyltransferase FkbM family [Nostoc sp. PCC 7107]|nr:methyltransferase FkbM family [Nostoc sp. PCC 7107]
MSKLKINNQFIQRVYKRAIKEYRLLIQPKIIQIEGIKIKIGEHISPPVKKAMYIGEYESSELRAVKSKLSTNDIVMELGAGIGLLSSYCAKRIGSERVFTYEANPRLEIPIRETYQINQVLPNLEICLVGEENGEQTFYVGKNFWSSSIIPWNEGAKPITVAVKSFNQEIRKINPSFLIIDIEGGEYDLLKYADFYNVKKLVIEIHPKAIGQDKAIFVKSKLAEMGFQINHKLSKNSGILEELFLERNN